MEVFEIHVTGSFNIHKVCKEYGLKTIAIDLLTPLRQKIREEHMTSLVRKSGNFNMCVEYVKALVWDLIKRGVTIYRVKIESPDYEHYRDQSLYMESHFVSDKMKLPTSRNQDKTELLATDRTYIQDEYDEFKEANVGRDIELCLFDSLITQDADWFEAYRKGTP